MTSPVNTRHGISNGRHGGRWPEGADRLLHCRCDHVGRDHQSERNRSLPLVSPRTELRDVEHKPGHWTHGLDASQSRHEHIHNPRFYERFRHDSQPPNTGSFLEPIEGPATCAAAASYKSVSRRIAAESWLISLRTLSRIRARDRACCLVVGGRCRPHGSRCKTIPCTIQFRRRVSSALYPCGESDPVVRQDCRAAELHAMLSAHHEAWSKKPNEARVKNRASVPRAGTREVEAMTPSCVPMDIACAVGRRRGYNSDRRFSPVRPFPPFLPAADHLPRRQTHTRTDAGASSYLGAQA